MRKIIYVCGLRARSFKKGRVPRKLRKFCNNGYIPIFVLTSELTSGIKSSGSKDPMEYKVIVTTNRRGKTEVQLMDDAQLKHDKLDNNSDFPGQWPAEFVDNATFAVNIAASRTRYAEKMQKLPGSKDNFRIAITLVKDNVDNLKTMVQLKVDATDDVNQKIRICHGAGFEYKQIVVRGKRKNALVKGTEPGVLYGIGEGEGMHQWEISTDGGQTQIKLDPTTSGVIKIMGLVSKKEYWVRNRQVLPRQQYGAWSGWISEDAP